jgi:hypothetical protein
MTDRYTKAVLTVIAIALTVIATQNVLREAVAQAGPTKVQVCDAYSRCAVITSDSTPHTLGEYGVRVVDGH